MGNRTIFNLSFLLLLAASGCPGPEENQENTPAKCQDNKDNDNDGFTDCQDQDCKVFAVCMKKDGGPPDGPMKLDQDVDVGLKSDMKNVCPASKSVWGVLIWDNGCLWQ